jgi:hypothetical protein
MTELDACDSADRVFDALVENQSSLLHQMCSAGAPTTAREGACVPRMGGD